MTHKHVYLTGIVVAFFCAIVFTGCQSQSTSQSNSITDEQEMHLLAQCPKEHHETLKTMLAQIRNKEGYSADKLTIKEDPDSVFFLVVDHGETKE